jgi:hypothetical protein
MPSKKKLKKIIKQLKAIKHNTTNFDCSWRMIEINKKLDKQRKKLKKKGKL